MDRTDLLAALDFINFADNFDDDGDRGIDAFVAWLTSMGRSGDIVASWKRSTTMAAVFGAEDAHLATTDGTECPVCLQELAADPHVTDCGHVFCLPCFRRIAALDRRQHHVRCPICRHPAMPPTSGSEAHMQSNENAAQALVIRALRDWRKTLPQPK